MLRCFKSRQEKEEKASFLENGSSLLEELIAVFNGRQEIPICYFTAKELINATNNFAEAVSPYGYMYKGSINERQVLVKHLRYDGYDSIRDIAIGSQMSLLKNVLKLSGCCLEFKRPAMVYEYVQIESLSSLCYEDHYNDLLFAWGNRINIATGIANSILYLHTAFDRPIIYRDLCPSKVIIDRHGVAKLFDFSFSISIPRGESRVEDGIRGTWGFIDPEYLASGFATLKTDVYGFGVLLLVIVTGRDGYCKNSCEETIHIVDYVRDKIENDQLSQIIDHKLMREGLDQQQQRAILDLALRCTQQRGEDRPEMIDVAKELRQIARS